MKLLINQKFLAFVVVFLGLGLLNSCTHDNDVPPAVVAKANYTAGTNVHLPGNLTTGNPAEWKLDKVHSSCLWQTAYVGAAGLLTGRFNQFGMHNVIASEMINYTTTGQPLKDTSWAFYENDDSKTYFNGYVQINTSNTGEPGRDAGCNIGNMGTVAIVAGTQNLTQTNLAKIFVNNVKFDKLTGLYDCDVNLNWQGKLGAPITKVVPGKLKYIPKATINGTAPYDVFGLQLKFQFNCRDFGVTSTSIGDMIEIECNMNFNNK